MHSEANDERIARHRLNKPTLEARIASTLSNDRAASCDIESVLKELEIEIGHAEFNAAQAREAALEPTTDLKLALEAQQLAAATVARLQHCPPMLEQQLRATLDAEYRQRWRDRFHIVEVKRNQASMRFARVAELVDIFQEAEAVDKEISALHGDSPAAETYRLDLVEQHARGLEYFTRDRVSLLKDMRLLDFASSAQLWPPKRPGVGAFMFGPSNFDYGAATSGDWWQAPKTDGAAYLANWHEQQAEAQEQRRQQEQQQDLERRATPARRVQQRSRLMSSAARVVMPRGWTEPARASRQVPLAGVNSGVTSDRQQPRESAAATNLHGAAGRSGNFRR
jgi:hypothetical protein